MTRRTIRKGLNITFVSAMLLMPKGCRNADSVTRKEIVDSFEYPTITVSATGQMVHKGEQISEDDLVDLVKKEVEQGYLGKNSSHDYGIIMIDADERVSYGRVREIRSLILKHGGRPADLKMKFGSSIRGGHQEPKPPH